MARPKPDQPPPRPAGPAPDPGPAPRPGPAREPPKRNPPTEAEREFGRRLRQAREAAGWTSQTEAAKELKIPPSRLAEYEKGQRTPPVLRLVEIVRALGLDASTVLPELFEGWTRKKKNPLK